MQVLPFLISSCLYPPGFCFSCFRFPQSLPRFPPPPPRGISHIGPHVLGGVEAEAADAHIHQAVEVVHDALLGVRQALVQVGQTHQRAVLDVVHVRVVVDVA